MFKRISILSIVSLITLLLLFAISIDLTPYLRGPGVYPPDWRWPYELSNTIERIWAPLTIIGVLLLIFTKSEKISKSKNTRITIALGILILLGFFFQISLLYYSRAGVEVIAHRIINPMISGYFTASLNIQSISEFMNGFSENLEAYPMYAKFHPPGGILFFHFLEIALKPFSHMFINILNTVPSHPDVAGIWKNLTEYQRFSALSSGVLIAFIANLAIVPMYLTSRILYGKKAALRSAILFLFVPSILLFTPLIDVFMPIFTAISLYFFVKGRSIGSISLFFLSGFVLFLGLFFTLTFLPMLLLFALILLIDYFKEKGSIIKKIEFFISFLLGFLVTPFVLLFSGFNFIELTRKIMILHESAQSGREHLVWVFYNFYDFLLFAGIPVGIIFIYLNLCLIKALIKSKKAALDKIDPLFLAFILMLTFVNFSGVVRAETARIWIPYIPFLILIVANTLTNKLKFTKQQFSLLLLLQALQILIFQSVIVTLW